MHLAWRSFTGLGFDHEIPHHSSSSSGSIEEHGQMLSSSMLLLVMPYKSPIKRLRRISSANRRDFFNIHP